MDGEEASHPSPEDLVKEEQELTEDMMEEEVSQNIPEHLVEKIIAMMPFPWICKARRLSKSWLVRFSPISSQDDEASKVIATSFQKQVDEWSKNWEAMSPFIFSQEKYYAYDGASHFWQRMPSLSFLPDNLLAESNVQIEGALLCLFSPKAHIVDEIYVASILTRSWKQLPPRPYEGLDRVLCHKFVSGTSLEAYKVFLLCEDDSYEIIPLMECCAHIYDSESDAWSRETFTISDDFKGVSSSYLNGVFYLVGTNAQSLLKFNLEERTWEQLQISVEEGLDIDTMVEFGLVVCDGNLLMTVKNKWYYHEETRVQVLKIDLELLKLSQFAQGPPSHVEPMWTQPVSDGRSIFWGRTKYGCRVLSYNVGKDEWSCFPVPASISDHKPYKWIGSSFPPPPTPFFQDTDDNLDYFAHDTWDLRFDSDRSDDLLALLSGSIA